VSGHPKDPNIVLLSVHNSEPILLNVVTNSTKKLNLPFAEEIATSTASTNSSKNPYLLVCAKYGRSGKKIYCLSSKSTLSIYDSQTLDCISNISDDNTLPSVPNVDISITRDESHLICTTSKGVLEFNTKNLSEEPKVYATGSVRAPWSICCYSGDENFVVGLPVQRLRYVGEQGFYSWNRRSFRMQHNMGLKDGISTIEWEPLKQSLIAISSTGGLFYLEEDFKSNWAGPMYPAGFRLLTDNEWYMEPEDEFDIKPNQDEHDLSKDKSLVVDVFTKSKSLHGFDEPLEKDELLYLSSIPIFSQFKRHGQVLPVPGGSQNNPVEEKTFGFQSVFEPMPKSLQKAKEMALNRWSNTSKTISKKSKKKKRR
jgi:hypothetical protein